VVQQSYPKYLHLGTESLLVSVFSRSGFFDLQSTIRNVGLFRYWTLPNLPLFLMAAPMLWLMLTSSVTVLRTCVQPHLCGRPVRWGSATDGSNTILPVTQHASELALPQLVLAVAAATSFHVQIVNRIASGYPTWYSMVATWLVSNQKESSSSKNQKRSQLIVRGMIVYAIAQGMLFANFLPPA
jgi:phosphatidylinositol glycan class V